MALLLVCQKHLTSVHVEEGPSPQAWFPLRQEEERARYACKWIFKRKSNSKALYVRELMGVLRTGAIPPELGLMTTLGAMFCPPLVGVPGAP